jgi:hypothetical protein
MVVSKTLMKNTLASKANLNFNGLQTSDFFPKTRVTSIIFWTMDTICTMHRNRAPVKIASRGQNREISRHSKSRNKRKYSDS